MKKLLICLFMVILFSFNSCSVNKLTNREIELQERNIVEKINFVLNEGNALVYVDVDSIEATTEIASQILLCHVESVNNVYFSEMGDFSFTYDMKIEKILFDSKGVLKEGENIPVKSLKGILTGAEFLKISANSSEAQKYGYANRDYEDSDIIISTAFNSIPIEVGKSYLMYISDAYLEKEKLYVENGRSYLYEYTDGIVYEGIEYKKLDLSFKNLEQSIKNDIEKRSGRVEEIGLWDYLTELGQKQAEERKKNEQSID